MLTAIAVCVPDILTETAVCVPAEEIVVAVYVLPQPQNEIDCFVAFTEIVQLAVFSDAETSVTTSICCVEPGDEYVIVCVAAVPVPRTAISAVLAVPKNVIREVAPVPKIDRVTVAPANVAVRCSSGTSIKYHEFFSFATPQNLPDGFGLVSGKNRFVTTAVPGGSL